jgi:hypothetical protein
MADLVRGEVDGYLWRRALVWTRWEAFRWRMRHRLRFLLVPIALAVLFQVLVKNNPYAGVDIVAVAAGITVAAWALWEAIRPIINSARSLRQELSRLFLIEAALVVSGLLLLTKVAVPPAGPGVLGAALITSASMVGSMWVVMTTARVIVNAKLARLWKRNPRAALLASLIDLLWEISHPDIRNQLGIRAHWIWLLEVAATRMQTDMPRALGCRDVATDAWLAGRAQGAATALRRLKRHIAAPGEESWDRLMSELRHETAALATGQWGTLRWAPPPPPEEKRKRLQHRVVAVARAIAAIAVPIAAATAMQVLGLGSRYVTVAWIVSIIWAVIYLLTVIDPTVPSKIELARGFFSDVGGTRQAKGPDE